MQGQVLLFSGEDKLMQKAQAQAVGICRVFYYKYIQQSCIV